MKILASLLAVTLLAGCASDGTLTPGGQRAITVAGQIASLAVQVAATSGKITPTQATEVQTLITAVSTNPQAASVASASLYGGAAMAQAGVPVAQGASAPVVGTAIASAVPGGLTASQQAALLQAAALIVAKPVPAT